MSHNTLIEKIKADAAAEVASIKEAGQAEAAVIEREAERSIEAKRAAHEAALTKKLAQLELVALSKAKQAAKIALQRAKRDEINALFAVAESELGGQAAEGYVKLFSKYVADMLPAGVEAEKVTSPVDRLEETKQILADQKVVVTGDIKADPQIAAGLMLYTADGVYDITLSRIMSEARASLEMEVVEKVSA